RNLAALLTDRDPIIHLPSAGGHDGSDAGKGTFEGRYSPTFLRLERQARETGLRLPINRTRPVGARRGAGNGYLQRADNRGRILLEKEVRERFGIRVQLHNGRLTAYFDPLAGRLRVGETFAFNIGLQDDSMPKPVLDRLTIRIVEEDKEEK